MFGRMLKNMRHAAVIYGVMMVMFVGHDRLGRLLGHAAAEPGADGSRARTTGCRSTVADGRERSIARCARGLPVDQELGNLEGKELRFGTSAGATFAAVTTAVRAARSTACTTASTRWPASRRFTGMWLNCVFGGKGVGLINMLVYLIIGVFLAGLMVGRTPEYLGKKVEAREMKLAMLALLIHPILILARPGCSPPRLGHQGDQQSRRPRLLGNPLRVQLGVRQQRLGLRRAWQTPMASTTTKRSAAPVQPALGHRHRPGDAVRPLHSDHRSARAGGEPGGEEADAVHGRHAAHRHGRRSASCCSARSCWWEPCCSCRRPCWARWPSISGRCRSAADVSSESTSAAQRTPITIDG